MNADVAAVRELAEPAHGGPVLSVHLRTDPRDPANTNHVPGWLVALRNGLRAVTHKLELDGSREDRLAMRDLRDRVETDVVALEPSERARGLALFAAADGGLDRRFALQLPPRDHVVRWDARPFVSPLIDVADRGRATGLVLVGGDAVRLLHWEGGRVSEPDRSLYELELGDWRRYAAYAMSNPARGQQTSTNVAAYEQRVEDWRRRFLRDAASAVARRLDELGWDRVVVAHEGQVALPLDELPAEVRRRVVAHVEANVLWEEPAAVGERLEGTLDEAWRREAAAAADEALQAAHAGGAGALGWDEVLGALAHHRVEHLILDPQAVPAPELVDPSTLAALGRPGAGMLAERAVERAVAAGARVTALPADRASALREAGGVAARLRW